MASRMGKPKPSCSEGKSNARADRYRSQRRSGPQYPSQCTCPRACSSARGRRKGPSPHPCPPASTSPGGRPGAPEPSHCARNSRYAASNPGKFFLGSSVPTKRNGASGAAPAVSRAGACRQTQLGVPYGVARTRPAVKGNTAWTSAAVASLLVVTAAARRSDAGTASR